MSEYKKMFERLLNWLIIVAAICLITAILTVPKTDCEVCNLDGQNGIEFFNFYNKKCLQYYSVGQENPNRDKINYSQSPTVSLL